MGEKVIDITPRFRLKVTFRLIMVAVIVIAAIYIFFTSLFTIGPEEQGVIVRFGRYNRTVDPGLNIKMPFGIENVYRVRVQRQLKEEFGFRTQTAGVKTVYSQRDYNEESVMLTGDLNAADVEWIVQFRIRDPYKFLFRVRNALQTFRDINEAVMRIVVGDRTVNEVLTVGRQEIGMVAQRKLQKLCDQYELGIHVEQVALQDVTPPDPVKPSFNEVNEAQQEREKLINQAWSEYNKVIPKARGEAAKTIEEAKGYAIERTNNAKGDVARFQALLTEYNKAPEVTRKRLYLETMSEVLATLDKKVILDENAQNFLPLLQLDKGGVQK